MTAEVRPGPDPVTGPIASPVRAATPGWFDGPLAGTAYAEVAPATAFTVRLPTGARPVSAGVDVTDVSRLQRSLADYGGRLLGRLCGPAERQALMRFDADVLGWGVALLFGLKEAVIKAAGGFPPGGRFTDVDGSELLLRSVRNPCEPTGALAVGGATGVALGGRPVVAGARRFRRSLLVCWAATVTEIPHPNRAGGTTPDRPLQWKAS